MANKHIFIGLGGSGVNTVAKTKYKIYERVVESSGRSKSDVMADDYRFIFVDTDDRDVKAMNDAYKSLYENGHVDFISPSKELVDLGDQNPHMIYQGTAAATHLKVNKRIREACSAGSADKMENRNLRHGAGAYRMKSRIALARKYDDFTRQLSASIDDLVTVAKNGGEECVMHYWVVASCNGGTGSGIFNDVLYYVNMLHKFRVSPSNPKVTLVLYMPKYYIDANAQIEKYPRNAYACLNEIETFQCLAKDREGCMLYHRLALRPDYVTFNDRLPYRPFEYCIPVDYQTEKETVMGSIENMYNNTAEMLYYVHEGAAARGFVSFFDNYQDGELTMPAKCFNIPMGYVALRKPVKDFQDYISIRFQYEILKYGVIGNPVESKETRTRLMKALFNNIIGRQLFENGAPGAYGSLLRSLVSERIDEDMPDNLIHDSRGEVMTRLPDSVSKTSADTIVEEVRKLISTKTEEKKNAIESIEKQLWVWVEENSAKYGLEYVVSILSDLDEYCTQLYNDYTTDAQSRILRDLKVNNCRKSLVDNNDAAANSLDDLYQRAIEITLKERVTGNNRNDVMNYFCALREWIEGTLQVDIHDELFSIIHRLSVGERGIIDVIRSHAKNLLSAAYQRLNDSDSGVEKAYVGLADKFLEKGKDVTSVYLPDITSFVDSKLWKEEGNKFSEWYSSLVSPSNDYVRGMGMIPERNGVQNSLESYFKEMVRICGEKMIRSYYLVGEDMHLFTNTKIDQYSKMVEDILSFAYETINVRCRESNYLNDMWYNKPLATFYGDLDIDQKKAVRERMVPSIFFSFDRSKHNNTIIRRTFCVAPSLELAKDVFGYQEGDMSSSFYQEGDKNVMYIMAGTIGVSFEYYSIYDSLKSSYDSCLQKELCHIHQAIAASRGDASNIRLPKEISNEMKVFVKYLVLERMCSILSDYIYHPSESYELNNYQTSPFVFDGAIAKIASFQAYRIVDERIAFKVTDGGIELYDRYSVENQRTPMTCVFNAFESRFINGGYAGLAETVTKEMNFVAAEAFMRAYPMVLIELKNKYNQKWTDTDSRLEKETLADIMTVLNEVYPNYNSFISE